MKQNGYTLIEILVTISIIGVLVTIGVASYHNFNRQRTVDRAADELQSYFRLAASKAQNNEKDTTICTKDEDILEAWHIDLSNATLPTMYGECNTIAPKTFPSSAVAIDLFGATVSPNNDIEFYPLVKGGGTNLPSPLPIVLSKNGKSKTITLDPLGNIH